MLGETIQIIGEVVGQHELIPIPEIKKDIHCILDVISNKFHYTIVSQTGSYSIQTNDHQISGELHPSMKMVREYSNIQFHLKFEGVPQTSYLPLQSMTIETVSHDGFTKLKFHNLLIHFDQNSPVMSILKTRGNCSFTYPNNHSGIVTIFNCVKFVKPQQGLELARYYGLPEPVIHGYYRNHHGVRRTDLTVPIDDITQYSNINEIEEKECSR